MIRVVHCVGSLAPRYGGPARTVTALTDNLAAEDDCAVVLLSQRRQNDGVVTAATDSRVDRRMADSALDIGLVASWPLKRMLYSLVRERAPSLLHDHGIWRPCNHYVAAAARRFGIPLMIHPRGMLESWSLQHHGRRKRLALRLYQYRDLETAAVLFATADQEAESIRRLGLRQPIAIIPNGVKIASPRLDQALRKGVPQGPRTALFLSRIHPKKGLLNLIDAWNRLRPVDWRLRLAGPDEGGHRAEVMRRARTLGLDASVDYVGEVDGDAKATLYEHADLFVLPSFSENFGVVVAEALAYGVPVITTKGTPWQGLQQHECGWWIDPDVDALLEALRAATTMSPAMLRAMGNNGPAYAREFDWASIARQTADVYRWVLGQGPMPGCVVVD